jgi:NhaP-type Na+/H+ or K+/H+ antiporter
LVNDATGLLALEFAIAMVVQGRTPTVAEGAMRLTYMIAVGLLIGFLLGLVVEWFERRIDDGPIEIVISILTPYAAYLAAQSVQTSGVLAVMACGLYLRVTLVLQGLTLPPLIRALGLAGTAGNDDEEEEARRIITSTALTHIESARGEDLQDELDLSETRLTSASATPS